MITQDKWLSAGVFTYAHDTVFDLRKGTNLILITLQFVLIPFITSQVKNFPPS